MPSTACLAPTDRRSRRAAFAIFGGDVDDAAASLDLHGAHSCFMLSHAENVWSSNVRARTFRGLIRDRTDLTLAVALVSRATIEAAKPVRRFLSDDCARTIAFPCGTSAVMNSASRPRGRTPYEALPTSSRRPIRRPSRPSWRRRWGCTADAVKAPGVIRLGCSSSRSHCFLRRSMIVPPRSL